MIQKWDYVMPFSLLWSLTSLVCFFKVFTRNLRILPFPRIIRIKLPVTRNCASLAMMYVTLHMLWTQPCIQVHFADSLTHMLLQYPRVSSCLHSSCGIFNFSHKRIYVVFVIRILSIQLFFLINFQKLSWLPGRVYVLSDPETGKLFSDFVSFKTVALTFYL